MNQFENVCDNCPLRAKVNVDVASEVIGMGTDGVRSGLSDGSRRYLAVISEGEVNNSDEWAAAEQSLRQDIEECSGPDVGVLRQKCGVGLARAWRWSERVGSYKPNISSPEEVTPLLGRADYRDALPYIEETTYLVGSLRDFSELDCSPRSAFFNLGIRKTSVPLRGTSAEIKNGKGIMLDRVSWAVDDKSLQDIFRIRIAQGGPQFAFRSLIELTPRDSQEEYANNIERIFAEGVYTYLFSTPDTQRQSAELIASAEASAAARLKGIEDWIDSGALRKAIRKHGRRPKGKRL